MLILGCVQVLEYATEIGDDPVTAHVLQQLVCCALRLQDFPTAVQV